MPTVTIPITKLPIEHIDGDEVDPRDHARIMETRCLNCTDHHNPGFPIYFTRTLDGIIWWHRHHCNPIYGNIA